MDSESEAVEQRLKSFTVQLQSECGILERLVYKHKNQHRRCSYFQYILKVRRDLKLLKLAKVEEVFDASFLVVSGSRPKQKLQLLESLKRRRCDSGKYNFLERLHGVSRLLSQMVEPILKAAMEISTLLAQSFFMKFSLTILAVLARVRVLVQQMLIDSVHMYNVVSALSQKEQTVKLNQEGFEVFREYYPKKKESATVLECIWQTDRFVLVERIAESETKSLEKDVAEDILIKRSEILYQNIEVLLGVDESGLGDSEDVTTSRDNAKEKCFLDGANNDEKNVEDAFDTACASSANIVSKDVNTDSSVSITTETPRKRSIADSSNDAGLPSVSRTSPPSDDEKYRHEKKKRKVAFVSVRPPVPSATNQSRFQMKGTGTNGGDKEDPFFRLLSGGNEKSSHL